MLFLDSLSLIWEPDTCFDNGHSLGSDDQGWLEGPLTSPLPSAAPEMKQTAEKT